MHKISLEQWRAFIAVVDYGGFAQAGDALFKTQPTISHSIKKLEQVVGKPLFDVVGRKAVLTSYGASLLVAARTLVTQADNLEHEAISQKSKIQQSLKMAVDTLFPKPVLGQILSDLNTLYPELNIQIHETTLSRCAELLEDGTVDVGIASLVPRGYTGTLATTVELYAVAHNSHSLVQHSDMKLQALEPFKQVVIRDAGLRANINSGWLGSVSRLTVSSLSEAVFCVKQQLGFAWLPGWLLQLPENNDLVKLPLQHGLMRTVALQVAVRQIVVDEPVIQDLTRLLARYLGRSK
ncbi:LysR family transcriptional regulator [Alteromonas sp. CYL-A6]|uniref:LysR family transcriptional regulator n=1 Tax=Alteromonas nitratireducens TaxID=3390813 RepID=UPI0034BD52D8